MGQIQIAYKNLLEISTVSLTAGTQVTGPLSRLYDRRVGRLWQGQDFLKVLQFEIDQASNGQTVNAVIIASGHDMEGETIAISRSSDDVVYNDPSGWSDVTPIPSGVIVGTCDDEVYRYWHVQLEIAVRTGETWDWPELFLTQIYTISSLPIRQPGAPENKRHNTVRRETSTGLGSVTRYGASKWRAVYPFVLEEADKDIMLGLLDGVGNISGQSWRGEKPFFIKDVGGTWRWVNIINDPIVNNIAASTYTVTLELEEEIS